MPEPQPKRKRGGGPRTPEGKARSSLNAVKHGLSARKVVLKNESQEEFDELLAGLTEAWQPVDTMEAAIVADMAAARWRLQRIWSVEATVIDIEVVSQEDAVAEEFNYADAETRTALAMKALCSTTGEFALISRYEARHRRAFDRSLSNLLRLRKERREEQAARGPEPPPEPPANPRPGPRMPFLPGGAGPRPAAASQAALPVPAAHPAPPVTARPDTQIPFLQNKLAAEPDAAPIEPVLPSRERQRAPMGFNPPAFTQERDTTGPSAPQKWMPMPNRSEGGCLVVRSRKAES